MDDPVPYILAIISCMYKQWDPGPFPDGRGLGMRLGFYLPNFLVNNILESKFNISKITVRKPSKTQNF